jgi:hypothetical protein
MCWYVRVYVFVRYYYRCLLVFLSLCHFICMRIVFICPCRFTFLRCCVKCLCWNTIDGFVRNLLKRNRVNLLYWNVHSHISNAMLSSLFAINNIRKHPPSPILWAPLVSRQKWHTNMRSNCIHASLPMNFFFTCLRKVSGFYPKHNEFTQLRFLQCVFTSVVTNRRIFVLPSTLAHSLR